MTPNGHNAYPLDKAAIREPFLPHRFWLQVFVRQLPFVQIAAKEEREPGAVAQE